MRKSRLVVSTVLVAMAASFTAMAGTWKSDSNGWWYDEGNGSYPKSTWSWIDGNNDGVSECYYFDSDGYCLINTLTPDNYYVDQNGAWVVNGVVQTKATGAAVSNTSDSVEVVNGKITIGDKKKKNSNKNSSNDEDEYDEDEYDNEEDDSEEEEKKSSSKKSSTKSGKTKFVDGLNMFDLPMDASNNIRSIDKVLELRGIDWTLGKEFWSSSWGYGSTGGDPYVDYYLGGKYKKLSIKATPKTNDFGTNHISVIYVMDAETEDVLYTQRVTADTKLINIEADVTDVNYVRIVCARKDSYVGIASIIMTDAILTK